MKSLLSYIFALFLVNTATISHAEQFVVELYVPPAGTTTSFTNTYNQVINIQSAMNSIRTNLANNVVGKTTSTSTITVTNAVFASGITTNFTTRFAVNDLIGLKPSEVVTITNSAAAGSVLRLTIKTK